MLCLLLKTVQKNVCDVQLLRFICPVVLSVRGEGLQPILTIFFIVVLVLIL